MADFLTAYRLGHKNEGDYANDPLDRGGETWRGIARKMHPTWPGWAIVDQFKKGKTVKQINATLKTITRLQEMVLEFYKVKFWDVFRGDEIKYQFIANELYDAAINTGHVPAIKMLQNSYGLPETGKMNLELMNKINDVE